MISLFASLGALAIATIAIFFSGCRRGHLWMIDRSGPYFTDDSYEADRICARCGKVELRASLNNFRIRQLRAAVDGKPIPEMPGALSLTTAKHEVEDVG